MICVYCNKSMSQFKTYLYNAPFHHECLMQLKDEVLVPFENAYQSALKAHIIVLKNNVGENVNA